MGKYEHFDDYREPNEGSEYKLSIGEKLEAVKEFSNLVDNLLLDNIDKVHRPDGPDQFGDTKLTLAMLARLDEDMVVAVTACRTYREDDSHADLVALYNIGKSIYAYSQDGEGMVRRLDMVGDRAVNLINNLETDHDNVALEQNLGLNNQPVDADEIKQLKRAVDIVTQNQEDA